MFDLEVCSFEFGMRVFSRTLKVEKGCGDRDAVFRLGTGDCKVEYSYGCFGTVHLGFGGECLELGFRF